MMIVGNRPLTLRLLMAFSFYIYSPAQRYMTAWLYMACTKEVKRYGTITFEPYHVMIHFWTIWKYQIFLQTKWWRIWTHAVVQTVQLKTAISEQTVEAKHLKCFKIVYVWLGDQSIMMTGREKRCDVWVGGSRGYWADNYQYISMHT